MYLFMPGCAYCDQFLGLFLACFSHGLDPQPDDTRGGGGGRGEGRGREPCLSKPCAHDPTPPPHHTLIQEAIEDFFNAGQSCYHFFFITKCSKAVKQYMDVLRVL